METEVEIAEVELQNKKEKLRKLSEEIIPARMNTVDAHFTHHVISCLGVIFVITSLIVKLTSYLLSGY